MHGTKALRKGACGGMVPLILLGVIFEVSHGFSHASLPSLRTPRASASSTRMSMSSSSSPVNAAAISRRSALGLLLTAPAAVLAQPTAKASPKVVTPTCDDAVSELRNSATGQVIYLIGTAHVSDLSAVLVRETIRSKKPDTVMIELDKKRVKSTIGPRKEEPQSFWQLARNELGKQGPSFGEKIASFKQGVIGMVIGGLYTKLNQMGFSSGQEFVVAIREANALNATIVLGDRGVDHTLARLQESLDGSGIDAVQKFIKAQTESPLSVRLSGDLEAEGVTDKEELTRTIEALKERSTVRELMGTLKATLPKVHAALIAERDAYMANSLVQSNGRNTVAVVGMAHMDGIEANLAGVGFVKVPCTL